MTTDEIYRESARRSHKLLGAYLAFWAWKNKVDCVLLGRDRLLAYLGVETMQRAGWLKEDLEELFPDSFWVGSSTSKYEDLYISRVEIPVEAKKGSMTTADRVELLNCKSARLFYIPSEDKIIRMMAELSHGISDFSEWEDRGILSVIPLKP